MLAARFLQVPSRLRSRYRREGLYKINETYGIRGELEGPELTVFALTPGITEMICAAIRYSKKGDSHTCLL
jgi:hypothetical protein